MLFRSLVVSSNPGAYAINRAAAAGIEAVTVCRKELGDQFETQLLRVLDKHRIEMIVLAGFMSILSADFISHYENRIINIPAVSYTHLDVYKRQQELRIESIPRTPPAALSPNPFFKGSLVSL